MSVKNSTIVVGCDGSWHSHRAVIAATREAVLRQAELVILAVPSSRVLHADRLRDAAMGEQDALATATGMARSGLAWARDADASVRARTVVLGLGSPELTTLLGDAELLVLGGRGGGGQRAFSLGSTSRQLAHGATAALLLVAEEASDVPRGRQPLVVVGLDSQPWSHHALAYAAQEATLRDATLVAVRAVLPGSDQIDDAVARAHAACAALIADVCGGLQLVEIQVPVGPVLESLVGACPPHGLLVLGNKGSGTMQGPVPGSLTQKLLERAVCDVVLVPSPAADNPAEVGLAVVGSALVGSAAVPESV